MGERYGRSRAALPLYHPLRQPRPIQRSAFGDHSSGRAADSGSPRWTRAPRRFYALRGYGMRCLLPAGKPGRPTARRGGPLSVLRRVRSSFRSLSSWGCVVCSSLVVVSRRRPLVPAPGVWACSVYVGRPSPLGSPFPVSRFGRAGSIQQYRVWLRAEVRAGLAGRGGPAWSALVAIAGLVRAGLVVHLVCWCAPLPCHGEVVAAAVSWLLSSGRV